MKIGDAIKPVARPELRNHYTLVSRHRFYAHSTSLPEMNGYQASALFVKLIKSLFYEFKLILAFLSLIAGNFRRRIRTPSHEFVYRMIVNFYLKILLSSTSKFFCLFKHTFTAIQIGAINLIKPKMRIYIYFSWNLLFRAIG